MHTRHPSHKTFRTIATRILLVIILTACLNPPRPAIAAPANEDTPLALRPAPHARFDFAGVIGRRIDANLNNWLLSAPRANPGMVEMFRVRDRKPVPQIVPWAGEFVGKYLISAVQACRMTEGPELQATVRGVIDDLIATQADDGYLGPFRKNDRLLAHWDLWGHYHVMLALMMHHEDTGYDPALRATIRAADLICKTYLDTDRRALDAGSHEMNLSVIHALGGLYRKTRNPRYLHMVRHIEQDWQKAGDYFRQGLANVPFYRTPRPRWESLHCIQGLVELYRITGNEDYKTAFVNLWSSIMQLDRHNTGGFSTGEAAIGQPYQPGAIETCCTTAWMALTADMLQLTGDPLAADELEWSTFNSMLGSQHPTGRWWTYNTPMDGKREASAHTIVFQARAGTPELNCCSVNAPRGLGVLSEWAVLLDDQGPVVNYYGPSTIKIPLSPDRQLTLRQQTRYPADGQVRLIVDPKTPAEFNLRLRIPAWSARTTVRLNSEDVSNANPGTYLAFNRTWKPGDRLDIEFDMTPRHWTGRRQATGKASIYHGPLLLAFDQHFNPHDTDAIPVVDLTRIRLEPVTVKDTFDPIVLFDLPAGDGKTIRLCDFATAGAHGTEYRSWLPAANGLPPTFYLRAPADGQEIPPGLAPFQWTGHPSTDDDSSTYEIRVAESADLNSPILQKTGLRKTRWRHAEGFKPGKTYYWSVISHNSVGSTPARFGPWTFRVDPDLENTWREEDFHLGFGPDEVITASPLDGNADSAPRQPTEARGLQPAEDRHGKPAGAVAFNGSNAKIQYGLPFFPEEDYTVHAWIYVTRFADKQYQQVFSAWSRGGDDPLRISIMGKTICARIEGGGVHATSPVPIESKRWTHVAAVKEGPALRLYLDGSLRNTAQVPRVLHTTAKTFALGANPEFSGDEYFFGRIDDFAFHAQSFTDEKIRKIYEASKPK